MELLNLEAPSLKLLPMRLIQVIFHPVEVSQGLLEPGILVIEATIGTEPVELPYLKLLLNRTNLEVVLRPLLLDRTTRSDGDTCLSRFVGDLAFLVFVGDRWRVARRAVEASRVVPTVTSFVAMILAH